MVKCECKNPGGNGQWRITTTKEFTLTVTIYVSTHYYDNFSLKDSKVVGSNEFQRSDENVKKTVAHEEMHANAFKDWHDSQEAMIKTDFNTDYLFSDLAACMKTLNERASEFNRRFTLFYSLEVAHKSSGWPKDYRPPRETSMP